MIAPRPLPTFLIVLLIVVLGLLLPGLTDATLSPRADLDSNHDPSNLLDRRDSSVPCKDDKESAPTGIQRNTDYIISLKDDTTDEQFQAFKEDLISQGAEIKHEYSLIKAYAVSFKPHQLQELAHDPRIKSIEKDQEVHIQPQITEE